MWLERFSALSGKVFFAFCLVALLILLLSLIGMISVCCFEDTSPGNSLSFFINLATVFITVSVLLRGIPSNWTSDETYFRICMVYVAPVVLGFTIYTVSLTVKVIAFIAAFSNNRSTPFVEWKATLFLWLAISASTVVVVIWEIFFASATYRIDQETTTVNHTNAAPIYECRGQSPDGDKEQFAWRVSLSSVFAFFLVSAFILLVPLARVRVPDEYYVNMVACVLMIVNASFCTVLAIVLWFVYRPEDGARNAVHYVIIGSLELWIAFFSNVMVITGQVATSKKLRERRRSQILLRHLTIRDKSRKGNYSSKEEEI